MSFRKLLIFVVAFFCIVGCDKEKKDDFIIVRRGKSIVRYDGGNDKIGGNVDGDNNPDDRIPEFFEASISDGILSISFLDSGTYDLYIENKHGEVVYSSKLQADGQVYEYDLSAFDEDELYALVLKGSNGTFRWYFEHV